VTSPTPRLIETPRKRTVPWTGVMRMTTETTAETDVVGLGRGGRMSRQRKREAVLRLLRGEDLELVSRSLGGDGGNALRLARCLSCRR
jgi:hypothetical protein